MLSKCPDIKQMQKAKKSLSGRIVSTPVLELTGSKIFPLLPKGSNVRMKMELFQHTGSFKSRGVLLALDKLSIKQKENGVVAVSAGNHALAVSWASKSCAAKARFFHKPWLSSHTCSTKMCPFQDRQVALPVFLVHP